MTLTFENVCQGDRSGLYTAKQASISEFFFILAVLYFSFENVCQGDRSGLYTVKQASISEWQFLFFIVAVFFFFILAVFLFTVKQASISENSSHSRVANVLRTCC